MSSPASTDPVEFLDLIDGEFVIPADGEAGDELLYRQIPGHLWDEKTNTPSSTAFGPANVDRGRPSYARSSKVSANASFDWHNANASKESRGVWACSVSEVDSTGTRSVDDNGVPLGDGEIRSPGHAYIDYRHLEKPAIRQVRAVLLMKALGRNRLHPV